SFHAGTVYATLALELGLVWMMFLPRRWRIACFYIVTFWQIGVILTANYTFLNYLVLAMGVLLLDDQHFRNISSSGWMSRLLNGGGSVGGGEADFESSGNSLGWWSFTKCTLGGILLCWVAYVTTAQMLFMFTKAPLPKTPIILLEPFRIANSYGLFAVMTRGRFEIEFQGSNDGEMWVPYPFRYKPQDLNRPPGIYAPYQPRLDW